MNDPTLLTSARLRELLHYNPGTGVLTWIVTKSSRATVGSRAGCVTKHGYRIVTIDGEQVMAHRLAWFWMTGSWPSNQVDHENGVHDDNSWNNLRIASCAQNNQNIRKPRANNKTGYLGVFRLSGRDRYTAQICHLRRRIHLGCFDTPAAAHAAYVAAKRKLHEYGTL